MPEIVYVLTNEAMEGMVKIGRTTTSVEQRIRELDNTSMPLPFQCFYAAEVGNSAFVESKLHRIFSDKRIRSNREFFRADANQVKEAIQLAELKEVTPKVDVVVDASDVQALQKAVATEERRTRLRFSELDIPAGAVLTFAKDSKVTSTVVADGRVNYEGQILSPSASALLAVQKMGYQWAAVSGSDYWEFDGETLAARRLRLEDEQQ
jgi:T5orf172 domain